MHSAEPGTSEKVFEQHKPWPHGSFQTMLSLLIMVKAKFQDDIQHSFLQVGTPPFLREAPFLGTQALA